MRILVTGSRNHPDPHLIALAIMRHARPHETTVVVHGDCPTGADHHASALCADRPHLTEERHPADWEKHGRKAGPLRNQRMVDLGADVCLAFPYGESRGTRDCARRAEMAGIPVEWIYVDDERETR